MEKRLLGLRSFLTRHSLNPQPLKSLVFPLNETGNFIWKSQLLNWLSNFHSHVILAGSPSRSCFRCTGKAARTVILHVLLDKSKLKVLVFQSCTLSTKHRANCYTSKTYAGTFNILTCFGTRFCLNVFFPKDSKLR